MGFREAWRALPSEGWEHANRCNEAGKGRVRSSECHDQLSLILGRLQANPAVPRGTCVEH